MSKREWIKQEYNVLEEIIIGKKQNPGCHFRLVESEKGRRYIESWSSLSKSWGIMYRYNVEEQWSKWLNHADIHIEGSEERGGVRRTHELRKTSTRIRRGPQPKARASSTGGGTRKRVKSKKSG